MRVVTDDGVAVLYIVQAYVRVAVWATWVEESSLEQYGSFKMG